MAFKPIDPKRDEYRRYLERGGIIESLTKVFIRILKDRPEDPTEYLMQNLGISRLQNDNIYFLQNELEEARNEIQRLTDILRAVDPNLLCEESDNINKVLNNTPDDCSDIPSSVQDNKGNCRNNLDNNLDFPLESTSEPKESDENVCSPERDCVSGSSA